MPTNHSITSQHELYITSAGRYALQPVDANGQRIAGAPPVLLARGDTINLTQGGRISTNLTAAQTLQLGNLGVKLVNGTNDVVQVPPVLLTRLHLDEGRFSAALPVTEIGARDGIDFEFSGRNPNDPPTGRILNNAGNVITKTGEIGPLLVPFGAGTERITVGHSARVTVTFGDNPEDSIVMLGHDVDESRRHMDNFRRRSAGIMQEALGTEPGARREEALVGRGYAPAPRQGEPRNRLLTVPALPPARLATPYAPPAAPPPPKGPRSALDGAGFDAVAVDAADMGGFAPAAPRPSVPSPVVRGPAGGRVT